MIERSVVVGLLMTLKSRRWPAPVVAEQLLNVHLRRMIMSTTGTQVKKLEDEVEKLTQSLKEADEEADEWQVTAMGMAQDWRDLCAYHFWQVILVIKTRRNLTRRMLDVHEKTNCLGDID